MAPAFKLSFSRPSFLSNPSSNSSFSAQSPQSPYPSRHDATPPSLPSSKAERVLGGPELEQDSMAMKKRQGPRERRSLRKFPSFMSSNSADTTPESAKEEQEFPFAGMKFPNHFEGQEAQNLRRQGSSPLLGYQASIVSTSSDYFSAGARSSPRRTETAGSFKSAPSMPRSPLRATYQITSPSMPDLSPLASHPHDVPPFEGKISITQTTTFERSGLSHSRSVSGGSAKSRLMVPRRRPSVTDPPTLYPETPRIAHAVTPPPALIQSSLPRSASTTNAGLKALHKPRWWARNKARETEGIERPSYIEPTTAGQFAATVKVNVKKPKSGASNWFDSYGEEDLASGEDQHPQIQDPAITIDAPPAEEQDKEPSLSEWPENPVMLSKKSSLSSKTTHSDRKLNLRFEFPASEPAPRKNLTSLPRKQPILETRDSQTSSLRSAESGIGFYAGLDLQMHSILSLSSSDEEDAYDDSVTKSGSASFQGHTAQTSLDTTFYQDEVSVQDAQRAQPVKIRAIANRVPRRQSSRRSKTPERVPPVPQIPSRHPVNQRSSSLRCSDILEERASSSTGGDSTIDSGSNTETPLTTPTSSCPSMSQRKRITFRNSKLMKVTSDEEKLLEAMRHKRASMHLNEYQKGFNEALALQEDTTSKVVVTRPSLDKLNKIPAMSRHESMKSSNRSMSPAPILTSARYGDMSLGAGLDVPSNPKRISTDSYNNEEEHSPGLPGEQTRFPFPPQLPPPSSKLPDPPVKLHLVQDAEVPAPKQSPTLSFGASDRMSVGTPSTTNMPLTPPPMIMSLPPDLIQGGLYTTMSEHGRKVESRLGHDRKRTISSVVVLDGMELAAREADEERDLIGWAMDTY